MTQKDPKDPVRAAILARRARFVAAALSANGLVGCGSDATTENARNPASAEDGQSPFNSGTPAEPTACLTPRGPDTVGPAPTPCLSPPAPTTINPVGPVVPTVCLSIAPTTAPTPSGPATAPTPTATTTPTQAPTAAPTPCLQPIASAPTPCLDISEPVIEEPPPIADAGPPDPSDGGANAGAGGTTNSPDSSSDMPLGGNTGNP